MVSAATDVRTACKEYFCLTQLRYYYTSPEVSGTSWQVPAALVLADTLTEMSMYNLDPMEALSGYQVRLPRPQRHYRSTGQVWQGLNMGKGPTELRSVSGLRLAKPQATALQQLATQRCYGTYHR